MTALQTRSEAPAQPPFIPDDLLERAGKRAAGYDHENRFFWEDFHELRELGYLRAAIPREFGGAGFTAAQVFDEQRRLAQRAPATALALNMHHYWAGMAADLRAWGDRSLDWILREAADGEVFAAGHGEVGNDVGVTISTASARRVDGGYVVNGRKIFGSLSPVWTRFGFHATDAGAPGGPQIVHGFLRRDDRGYEIVDTWDTMSMRATHSQDTVLDGAFVPDDRVARVIPAGEMDPFLLAMAGRGVLGFAAVYVGLAERAFELATAGAHRRSSIALTRSMAYHPGVQHVIAEAAIELEAIRAHFTQVASDWSAGVDHGALWGLKIAAAKHHVVEGAKRIVDGAMTVSGGGGLFRSNELERLYRDVRAGGFHPFNPLQAYEMVAKAALGIEAAEQPRWG